MLADQSRSELFLTQELGVRDLTTARIQLAATEVAIVLSPEIAHDWLGQLALLVAADILCRLGPYCPNISVVVPGGLRVAPTVPLLTAGAPFAAAVCQFMSEVQRPGERRKRRYRVGNPEERIPLAFVVGDASVTASQVIYGWYERWMGGFDRTPHLVAYRGPNPFGALVAGALGATAIARLLLAAIVDPTAAPQPLPDGAALSAYSYGRPQHPEVEPDIPNRIDLRPLEPVLLVGGGAVASGVALGLASLQRVDGTVDVADGDVLDATNLERHLISRWSDVRMSKANRLAGLFGDGAWNGLLIRTHVRNYEALPPSIWRTVIATVDQAAPRRRMQFDLPYILLNAGTVGGEFLVSRHDYGPGPCAECLYPERPAPVRTPTEILASETGLEIAEIVELQATGAPLNGEQIARIIQRGTLVFPPESLAEASRSGILALARAACSTARLRPDLPVATTGFVAALPGLLLAAELVKETLVGPQAADRPVLVGDRNIFRLDTLGDLGEELEPVKPSRSCRCQDEVMRAAYRGRWR